LQSLGYLEHTSDFKTVRAGVCWTNPVCVVTRGGSNIKLWHSAKAKRFGQA